MCHRKLCEFHHFCKVPEILLFPLPVAMCVPQSPPPLIGPLTAENRGNCCLHTMLACQENQGPWQMNHGCVAHIWLTASEEYEVFIASEI
jgi:hypothetical protein